MSAVEQSFDFGGEQVRVYGTPDAPEFVAADVARILGYRMASDMTRSIEVEDKGTRLVRTPSGQQEVTIITEAGLYQCIMQRQIGRMSPEHSEWVRRFQRWVTREVLPQIRKTGSYSAPKSLEERTLELVGELHAKVQEQAQEIETLTPLATQARTHNLGKGNVSRQAFAREIIKWALAEGYAIKQPQVMEFLGRKLDLFVVGFRSDNGEATISGERRGLSTTVKGTAENGHAYATGKLTSKGVEYAWSRIEKYVREHGHLELPQKGIAA